MFEYENGNRVQYKETAERLSTGYVTQIKQVPASAPDHGPTKTMLVVMDENDGREHLLQPFEITKKLSQ